MKIAQKQEFVSELKEKFSQFKFLALTDYKGLTVSQINDLRKRLREADVEFRVVKNTMLRRAVEGTEGEKLKEYFVGPSAVAISYTDPVEPAKILAGYAKENEKLEIKAAVLVSGEKSSLLDMAQVKTLSEMPSREELLAKLLSAMNEVPTGFVRTLNALPQNLMNVLGAIKDKKEAA